MKPRNDPAVLPWLAKRDEDLELMSLAMERAPHLADPIRFHAQQAAEKALKALLAACGGSPPHVHDLVLLLRLARDVVPDFDADPQDCEALTPFATLSRYPRRRAGDATPVDEAVNACRRIVQAVDAALGARPDPA